MTTPTTPAAASPDASALRRTLCPVASAGPIVVVDGRSCVNMASNDYLGLTGDPRLAAAARAAIDTWGVGSGASALVAGWTTLHAALARRLSAWLGREAAIVTPTGYAANVATLTALVAPGDAVVADRRNHASLIDAGRLTGARVRHYRHRDVDHARALLARAPADAGRFLVTDAVFSMDGTLAPLVELAALAQETGATLIVDEAHATGVLGPRGEGLARQLGVADAVDVHVGTCSKALGAQGGFVAARRSVIDRLVHGGRAFIYSTALAPPLAAAAAAAIDVVTTDPDRNDRRRTRLDELRRGLRGQGWTLLGDPPAPMTAVLTGSAAAATRLAAALLDEGVLAPAIRPPTVERGRSRIRLTPLATHTPREIEHVVAAFAACREPGDRP